MDMKLELKDGYLLMVEIPVEDKSIPFFEILEIDKMIKEEGDFNNFNDKNLSKTADLLVELGLLEKLKIRKSMGEPIIVYSEFEVEYNAFINQITELHKEFLEEYFKNK